MRVSTVLLVDRDADSLAIYSLFLEHHGFRVLVARSGAEGLRLALEEEPDVVVAELVLPAVEGRHFTEKLKEHPRTARLPVLALSTLPLFTVGRGAGPGVYDRFLAKPCIPSRMLREVERFVAGERRAGGYAVTPARRAGR